MALFDKCYEFKKMADHLRSLNQFFYLRQVDPAASPMVMRNGKKMIMLGSNNYLDLTDHPKVIEATKKAIDKYGTGSCGSRILTGTTELHLKMEKKLAEFKSSEDSITFSAGFMALMATIAAIADTGDVILSDELNHASIIEGCRMSRAKTIVYKHNDMADLEVKLASLKPETNKLIITDGVFSMKGTVVNLPGLKKLADKYDAKVMVDDAHGTGVLGEKGHGTLEHFNMEGQIDLVSGTFSKSLAAIGGFTCAKYAIIDFLRLTSRPFIFTASPPPSIAATVLACLEVIDAEPERVKRLKTNGDFLKKGLKEMGYMLEPTITPIIPILINNDEKCFKMAGYLEQEGVFVNPIIPPAVPKDESIIRVSLTAGHTEEDLGMALEKFKLVGKKLNII
jgi:8-amino-7-oxononanoate synthase